MSTVSVGVGEPGGSFPPPPPPHSRHHGLLLETVQQHHGRRNSRLLSCEMLVQKLSLNLISVSPLFKIRIKCNKLFSNGSLEFEYLSFTDLG